MICNTSTIIGGNAKHSWLILLLLCSPCEAPMPIVSELQTLPVKMVECCWNKSVAAVVLCAENFLGVPQVTTKIFRLNAERPAEFMLFWINFKFKCEFMNTYKIEKKPLEIMCLNKLHFSIKYRSVLYFSTQYPYQNFPSPAKSLK